YQGADGQTSYALSLSPPPSVAVDKPCDVMILFDTSASQTGAYRDTALAALEMCLAKLRPEDRVQILAVDLEARPTTDKFLPAGSPELHAAVERLREVAPLGSTDMEAAMQIAAKRFDDASKSNRAVLYLGDGMSTANLLGTTSFVDIIKRLR